MAVQAGCGFKPPTPVFAVPLPVGGGEAGRRADMTSSPPPPDGGGDMLMAGRRCSGQWVTLSKALLLQLVERICQLSFQPDVSVVTTSSNAAPPSRLHRKSSVEDQLGPEVEIESLRPPRSPSEPIAAFVEEDGGGSAMEDGCSAAAEENSSQTPPPCRQDDSVVPTETTLPPDLTASGCSSVSPRDVSASACGDEDHQESSVELDVEDASASLDEAGTELDSVAAVQGPRDPSRSRDDDEKRVDERRRCHQLHHHHHHHQYVRLQRSACRRRLLQRTRRRRKPPAAATTSSGDSMQVPLRCDVMTRTRDVRRCSRQSWMALSKELVIGAVESQLRHIDAPGAGPASGKSAIWNPATCLSPFEKRRSSRPTPHTDFDIAPPPVSALSDFRYRDVTSHQLASGDVVGHHRSSSSMLSELLGFGGGSTTVQVLPGVAAGVLLTSRQRHSSSYSGDCESSDVISPSVVVSGGGSGVGKSQFFGDAASVSAGGTAAIDYCIRRRDAGALDELACAATVTTSSQRIWRPVESYPVESNAPRRVARPRWVAVNKGDVCSLVDNLVSTMIACSEERDAESRCPVSDAGDVRDSSTLVAVVASTSSSSSSSSPSSALPVSARCSVAASEPRKWKSDLLQRMRNEDT